MESDPEIIVGEAQPITAFGRGRPSESFIATKLKESKRKVASLVLYNLLVCPFLCGIVLLSLWGDSKFEQFSFPEDICSLMKDVNGYLTSTFLLLWLIYHAVEVLLIVAVATDNLRFCKTYLTTVVPLLWILTILSFNLVMWSGLKPLEDNCMTKFIIVSGSTTALIAQLFSYHYKTLSEHVTYLAIYLMIYEGTELIEYV